MKTLPLSLLLTALSFVSLHAQHRADSLVPPVSPPNFFLKTNLFAPAEPDEAITLTLEYRPDLRLGYQLEAGYIFSGWSGNYGDQVSYRGYRLKPEIRLYMPGGKSDRIHFINYWAIELIYKQVLSEMNEFIGRDCGMSGCAYDQQMTFHISKQVLGIGGKAGIQLYLDRSKKLIIDFYGGLGIRYRWLRNNLPGDARDLAKQEGWFGTLSFPGWYPYIPAGIKIGLRLP